MLSRIWLAQVITGLALAGLFAAVTLSLATEAYTRTTPPLMLTVAEATTRVEAGETLAHVQLTDLVIHCDTQQLVERTVYAGALGSEEGGPLVIVKLDATDACGDGPLQVPGTLERPVLALQADLSLTSEPHVVMFRPHKDAFLGIAICVAMTLFGAGLTWRGLWRRRTEREWCRTLQAGPELPPESHQDRDPYRQEQDGVRLLPRPLRPDEDWLRSARRQTLAGGALGAGLLALSLLWLGLFVRDAIVIHATWASGEVASDVQIGGEVKTRAVVFNTADLVIVYTDANGRRRRGAYSRLALISCIADTREPVVKYDRDDPTRFAVSWLIDGFWGEVALLVVMLAMMVPGSLAMLRAPRRRLRELAEIREVLHSSPEEVTLEVLYAQPTEVKGTLVSTLYGLRLPEGATITEKIVAGERPLFLEIDESRALGLRCPNRPDRVVVLRDDLSPLIADESEAERVRLRHRRGRT